MMNSSSSCCFSNSLCSWFCSVSLCPAGLCALDAKLSVLHDAFSSKGQRHGDGGRHYILPAGRERDPSRLDVTDCAVATGRRLCESPPTTPVNQTHLILIGPGLKNTSEFSFTCFVAFLVGSLCAIMFSHRTVILQSPEAGISF